jgi:TolB-like protein/DNA-binding winged helix-turn-helix (wHTH) protein/Tfp pilus assembly protein PilF
VPLTPRVFQTLRYLVEHRGRVLDKEIIMEAVWPDCLVEENNLAKNISTLRRIFGDTPASQNYIVTVPGRGYRFAPEVTPAAYRAEGTPPERSATKLSSAEHILPTPARRGRLWPAVWTGAALLAIGAAALLFWRSRSPLLVQKTPGTPATVIPEKSIAVLPFENLSDDKENTYFVAGVQDEILSNLAKIADLKVISRTSANGYKAENPRNSREIGQQLGVAHLLEGSVQHAGDRVRVQAQLVHARTDNHVWAETYDRELRDIFAVESEIARNIAQKLQAKLSQREAQALAAPTTTNPAAYELYLKGRYFWNKRNAEALRKALEFFKDATKLDPGYAPAYAGIADTYGIMPTYDLSPAKECLPLAEAAAVKALELDETLAEAHVAYGGVLCSEYKWADARRHLERAIELDPNHAIAHEILGLEVLMNLGEVGTGWAELLRARELDPLSLILNTLVGLAHYRFHEYDRAQAQLRKTLELDPNFHLAHEVLAQTHDMQGRFDKAIAECRKALETSDAPGLLATLGHAYARSGNRREALKVLEQLQNQSLKRTVTAVNFAWLYVALGDKQEALNWLERAYDDEDGSLYGLKLDPFLDPLRDEPRFKQLLPRVFSDAETTSPVQPDDGPAWNGPKQ